IHFVVSIFRGASEFEFVRNIGIAGAENLSVHGDLAPVSERFKMKKDALSGVAPRQRDLATQRVDTAEAPRTGNAGCAPELSLSMLLPLSMQRDTDARRWRVRLRSLLCVWRSGHGGGRRQSA